MTISQIKESIVVVFPTNFVNALPASNDRCWVAAIIKRRKLDVGAHQEYQRIFGHDPNTLELEHGKLKLAIGELEDCSESRWKYYPEGWVDREMIGKTPLPGAANQDPFVCIRQTAIARATYTAAPWEPVYIQGAEGQLEEIAKGDLR